MKKTINSPFNMMTKEQENSLFNADIETNIHGKKEIEKERNKAFAKAQDKKAS